MTSRVQQTTIDLALKQHNDRLTAIERSDGSDRWIYVGTYPTDPNTTAESPPFENGWMNVNVANGVRFKRQFNNLNIDGGPGITGGADNSVVFTLPSACWPKRQYILLGPLADGSGVFTYTVNTDGTVVYVTSGAFA